MKKVEHGHRWTDAEMTQLIAMWCAHMPLQEIADFFKVSGFAVNKMITRMRQNGIPVPRRKAGHTPGRHNKPWTQEEVEYLVRRRGDKDTVEKIALDLGRTFQSVQAMVQKLRNEGVKVPMLGCGVRRKWSAEAVNMAVAGRGLLNDWEFEGRVPDDAVIQ